jgi:hypothetical protein
MRGLLFLGGGLLLGVGFAHTEAAVIAEKRAQERFDEQLESHKRVLQMATEDFLGREVDGPFDTEADLFDENGKDERQRFLDAAEDGPDAIKVGGEIIIETKLSDLTPSADYLATARDYSGPTGPSVELSGVEYITEDEYGEEDGRAKEQILIHMGADEPLFINEGIIVPDWRELISPNILVDMYQRVPPGTENRVLYVRNNRNDTDYEVIQEIP